MTGYVSGLIVFGLYLIYDYNSIKWKHWLPHCFFLSGTGLLGAVTAAQIVSAWYAVGMQKYTGLFLSGAVFFLLLLIYTLFFALPFDKTYLQQKGKPAVYSEGMYALCRHPGVIWFFLFYLCLGLAFWPSGLLCVGMFYSLLNLIYVIVQDCWTFPATFDDYEEYQKNVPFLLPTVSSVKRAFATRRRVIK